jgi:N-methylhydantoinase A
MQGNGGMMAASTAADLAVHTVMSGPAAGAIAAARIGVQAGYPNLVACDMGGTSFDVSVIAAGEPALSAEKDIAYGVPLRIRWSTSTRSGPAAAASRGSHGPACCRSAPKAPARAPGQSPMAEAALPLPSPMRTFCSGVSTPIV